MLQCCSSLKRGTISRLWRPLLSTFTEQAGPRQSRRFAEMAVQGDSDAALELHTATKNWYEDDNITARQGAKIVKQRLSAIGVQRVIHLTEIAKRVKTPEDAAAVMDVAQQFALHRANRQQHDGISPQTSYLLLKSITQVSTDKAVEVLKKAPELQLTFGIKAFREVIVRASKAGDLAVIKSAFEVLQATGIRPNSDLAFCVIRACFDNKRPDLAVAYASEFEANGVYLRPGLKELVKKAEQETQQQKAGAKQERADKAAGEAEAEEEQEESAASEGSVSVSDGPEAIVQPS